MSQTHPFDRLSVETLRAKACIKWQHYPADVLPLWVADMDLPVAEPITDALATYAHSNNLGYPPHEGLPGLKEALRERYEARFGWCFDDADIHLLNGIVPGLYLACLALASEGDEVIVQSPIYPPFISAIQETGRVPRYNPLTWDGREWAIDFDQLETLVTPATRLLMLCNPHNPTGRVFKRDELEKLADFALRHRLWIVSDELHNELVYEGHRHVPIASLGDEVAQRSVTLVGPTKGFNIAGLKIGFMVCQNPALLERLTRKAHGLVGRPNVMAQVATIAAYQHGQAWLDDAVAYLDGNRRFVDEFLKEHLPQVRYALPQGTYLAWLDFRGLGLGDGLGDFLLDEAKVGLNLGAMYGPGGEGFARLNFATSRAIVTEALTRIRNAWLVRLD